MDSTYFIHIKFPPDGVDVKLTHKGLMHGNTRENANYLGGLVKDEHTARIQGCSTIDPERMGYQIWIHAKAYVGCDAATEPGPHVAVGLGAGVVTRNPVVGLIAAGVSGVTAKLACNKVQRHANPVNATWKEVTYETTKK